jgi:hypothetical protein
MTELRDIVSIDHGSRPAAIRLDDALVGGAGNLIDAFTPTQSSATILRHLQRAVLPNARKEYRAMVWHGVYGSGKSHLGVLVGHLLANGSGGPEMQRFLDRLANQGEPGLRNEIESTFLAVNDPDARPYLVVPLYASDAPSLQSSLLEGLYRAIESTDGLDPANILPKTEYAAARERLGVILELHPEHRGTPLSQWNILCAAFNPDELDRELENVSPEALEAFKQWHPKVSAGAPFDPQDYGGKRFVDAYREAAEVLARHHGYKGIAVIWDEFGYAIESMIAQPERRPIDEIFELQNFTEIACAPPQAHTLFIALTHRSLREYGVSAGAGEPVKQRLGTIEGRFTSIRVELKASEAEGYHLLGALVAPTEAGRAYLGQAAPRADALAQVCARMPLFHTLATDISAIVAGCYPLHPVTAAGLFAIAAHGVYAQANRTVFTFFDNLLAQSESDVFDAEVDVDGLYGRELIRLPALMQVYRKEIYDEYPDLADGYRDAVAKVKQGFSSPQPKQDILAVLLLARVLGDDFQPTDAFLAAALYDQDSAPASLLGDLEDLSNAGLIWRRQAESPVWELEGSGGIQIGGLIDEEQARLPQRGFAEMLANDSELRDDLLPQCGIHDLEPSPAGIIRSFCVGLFEDPQAPKVFDLPHEGLSAQVFFALPSSDVRAGEILRLIDGLERTEVPTYVWLPSRGLSDLLDSLRGYRAILNLLQSAGLGDGQRRQLQSKADQVRAELRDALSQRLGRQALRQREVTIRRLGDPEEVVTIQSWHGFVDYISQQMLAAYSNEVPVRAMNANRLYPDSDRRVRGVENLLDKILEFDDLQASARNDLFGENETSELAGFIDGTLGIYTNRLLIERASGWDLKTPDEADGPAGEVLRLIRDRLLDSRKKVHDLTELRKELVRPPYGLPYAAMSVFAAVAIRKDHVRLKWVNKTGAFSSLLWSAFTPNVDGFKLRFDTFPPKQREVLDAVRKALRMPEPEVALDADERSRGAVKAVRTYYAGLPDALKRSAKLRDEAKRLFDLLKRPGQDDQEVAKLLCDLVQSAQNLEQQSDLLRNMFDAIERIADERRALVRQVIDRFSRDPQEWRRIGETLRSQSDEMLAVAIARVQANEEDGLDRLAQRLRGMPFAACSDVDVGWLCGELEKILEAIVRPPKPATPSYTVGDSTADHEPKGPDTMSTSETPADMFRQELTQLVARYRTKLTSTQLEEILAGVTAPQSQGPLADHGGG